MAKYLVMGVINTYFSLQLQLPTTCYLLPATFYSLAF